MQGLFSRGVTRHAPPHRLAVHGLRLRLSFIDGAAGQFLSSCPIFLPKGVREIMQTVLGVLAALAGAVTGLFTQMSAGLRLLLLLMAIDYISALVLAALGKSPKSASGALDSRAGFFGLARKAMILVLVLLAAILDQLTGSSACVGAVTLFYTVNEAISILENAVLLGVPIPRQLSQALDVAKKRQQADSPEKEDGQTGAG